MKMEPSYTNIGTTNRADPVNSMELLYPNGFNRNENRRDKPLVHVQDTAQDDDDFESDDFDFIFDGNSSENVTVTIKFSTKTDSVVAETSDPHIGDDLTFPKEVSLSTVITKDKHQKLRAKSPVCLNNETQGCNTIHQDQTSTDKFENIRIEPSQLLGACAIDRPEDVMVTNPHVDVVANDPKDMVLSQHIDHMPTADNRDVAIVENASLGACAIDLPRAAVEPGYNHLGEHEQRVDSPANELDAVLVVDDKPIASCATGMTSNVDENCALNLLKAGTHEIYNEHTNTPAMSQSGGVMGTVPVLSEPLYMDLQIEDTPANENVDVEISESQSPDTCATIDIPDTGMDFSSGTRTQDSLYDEYEKLLEPNMINGTINNASSTQTKSRHLSGEIASSDGLIRTVGAAVVAGEDTGKSKSMDKEKNSSDRNKKMAVKTPANIRPDCRLEMVSPITKTPIFVERSPSEDDDGEDFMNYLKELKKSSPVVTEADEKCLHSTMKISHETDSQPFQCTGETDTVLSIVEVNDFFTEDVEQHGSSNIIENVDNINRDVIVISDDEADCDDSIIFVPDDETKSADLLSFNFASLHSNKNEKQSITLNQTKDDDFVREDAPISNAYSVIEIESDTSTDTEDEDEDDADIHTEVKNSNQNTKDKDDDSDTDNGRANNNSRSNQDHNGHGNEHNRNGQVYDDNSNTTDGNSNSGKGQFSPGVRSRPSDSYQASNEQYDHDINATVSTCVIPRETGITNCESLVPRDSREQYSPEDIEVFQILDVCEKQSDVHHQFQTIDSYCFETSSEISADMISVASHDTQMSKCLLQTNQSSPNSNVMSSRASTSSFDVFADSVSNNSETHDDSNELDISLYDNISDNGDNMDCGNDIRVVCAKIQSLYHCNSDEEGEMLVASHEKIDNASLFSDSGSSDESELHIVSDFESAIEEQFWTKTADCSVASSDSDVASIDDEDDEVDENKYSDKLYSDNEKESESEYESADDDYDDDGDDNNENNEENVMSELDFLKEIKARISDKSKESVCSPDSTDCNDNMKIDRPIENTSLEPNSNADTNTSSGNNRNDIDELVYPYNSFSGDTDKKADASRLETEIDNGKIETLTRREIITAALDSQPRTITYQVPYFKKNEKLQLDHRLLNKLKLVCKLRQCTLNKLVPEPENKTCGNIDPTSDEDVSESVKHFKDEMDIEMKTKGKQHVKDSETETKHMGTNLKSGDTVQIGNGYYILGTGDSFYLPIGPKLRQGSSDKENSSRSSVYFRGIPGIINNAYKMSNSFPRLGVPNETASHRILHACNRLVTPQSPGKTKTKPELKHGMMQHTVSNDDPDESEDTDSSTASEMYEVLLSAKDLLNSSRFEDAETTFLKLYNEIQEKPDHNGRLLVETLTGLADICIRQSRMCRSNPLEWQWLCMHAIALLQYIVEYCESELENQLDNELIDWYQEHKQASELKCRPLEDAFNRALYNCLKHDSSQFDPFQSFSLPNTPVHPNRKSNLFPLSSTMPQYLVMPGMSYRVTDKGLTRHSADDSNVAVDWLAKFQHYCKDRLVNKDSKGVTEKILKSNSSKNDDDTESIRSAGSNGSLDWDHTDLQGIDEISMEITDQDTSPENDYTFEYEIVTSDTEKEGWDFFINQRRNCNFESVVQMAVHGEKGEERPRESQNMTKEERDIYQLEKSEKAKQKFIEAREIISPLHEHSISLTLARLFCRLADKLVQEEEYRKAEAVYEKILDIVDRIQDGTAGMLRFSARIMKNLGTVKSKQGKSSSGLVLLNKALHTYRDLQDEEANFEIAIALIELGNGYIVGKNHEDCVFTYVIIAICDFFEKDSGDTQTASTSSAGSASQLSQMTSSFGSTNEDTNVEEAVTCYTEAIALLDRYEADEKQIDMFAKAVMRLGDCYFMQNEYDKALECYEKSLTMFKANNMFGKDSLMENAHVLCMLGVSSFMLHVYPRAASVFEMALHLVRCAYGYKRTFLNGMLQSLAGITYYKMKNYHKCVSMCYQAHETYCDIFGDELPRLDKQKFWLVCQTLYVMGNSYNILNLQAKAMKYLTIARSLMKSSKSRERRQFMRVLQILGDAYFAQYDYKTALTYYNEALEYGECESQISFDEVFDPNCASDEMTIHNHLVSKSAEAHLSMQQYQNAVHYLEQAHDMQEVMGEDIKEDLINTLHQLGYMHSVSGDVNKAIEAYKECLEVFREIHEGELGPDMCTTLGNLGAMCYVKACIAEDPREDRAMTAAADDYFQSAMMLELNTEVCVKYGNFLYSQCKYQDAIFHLNNALSNDKMATDIVYGGLEKVTLPELLQDEVDTQQEICLPSSCLARYLLILCHKALHQTRDADDNLIGLMEEVHDYDVPLLHSVLGYAMMELMLFGEAATCFLNATENEEDYQLAYENYCICLLILVQRTLKTAFENIWLYYRAKGRQLRFKP